MKLNSDQYQAVTHRSGPLLIVAGAGTGKTTVITERIKFLIQEQNIDPYHIFAATFTQKAAEEMLSRLDQVMPLGYREPWLGTFHGLCERLLREEGLEIGLDPSFSIMTQTDQWIFFKRHLFDFDLNYYRPLGNPNKFITAIIKFFSRLSDEAVNLTEFQTVVNDRFQAAVDDDQKIEATRLEELVKAYALYQNLKHQESVLDFGDLITLTLQLFRDRPNLLAHYQKQFRYLMVDEFQDTNYAQYQLIKLLAPSNHSPQLTVVGDDDQAVYKFRGASISNILNFKHDYPQCREIVLTQNYRSTQPILDAAYQTIIHNNPDRLESKLEISKRLSSNHPDPKPPSPSVLVFPNLESEIEWTIKEIRRLVTEENLTYQDIAILARANSHLDPYLNALSQNGLPYQVVSNRGLYDAPAVKPLLLFLEVLRDPNDDATLFQFSQTVCFNLPAELILAAINQSKTNSTSLFHTLTQSTETPLHSFVEVINRYSATALQKPVSQLLYQFIQDQAYLHPFLATETIANQLALKNLNLFFNQLKHFETKSEDKTLIGFLEVMDLWLEAGENPGQAQIEDVDTISLMTVHAAKGLEFSAVFLGGLVAGRFPSINRRDPINMPVELIKEILPAGDEHIGEERRLFYVALTRAKKHLYLSYAPDLGGSRQRKMSGFLNETGLPQRTVNPEVNLQEFTFNLQQPIPQYLSSGRYLIKSLSYSQMDTFKICPLKYKYRYLLQIPAKPHHALSFGQSIHQTLFTFHQQIMHGLKPDLDQLISLYRNNFIDVGYDSQAHREERFQSGIEALTTYYRDHSALFGTPKFLEQTFKMTLNHTPIIGKIDRIDVDVDGQLILIDYKTGSEKTQKQADQDDQLTLYALAAKDALNLNIKTFNLYFVETGVRIQTRRSSDQLSKAKEKLSTTVETIKNSTYPAKPDPVKCGFCEYASLCPFASKKTS